MTTSSDDSRLPLSAASPRHEEYLRALRTRAASVIGVQIVVLVAFFGAWQFVTSWHFIDPFITSDPLAMIYKFVALVRAGSLGYHVLVPVSETIVAFAFRPLACIIIGVTVAVWGADGAGGCVGTLVEGRLDETV